MLFETISERSTGKMPVLRFQRLIQHGQQVFHRHVVGDAAAGADDESAAGLAVVDDLADVAALLFLHGHDGVLDAVLAVDLHVVDQVGHDVLGPAAAMQKVRQPGRVGQGGEPLVDRQRIQAQVVRA